MSVFVCVGIGFWLSPSFLLLLLLLLLSLARGFLSLFPSILFCLEKALLFLCLLKLNFLLGIHLLLSEFLLRSCGRFCTEILHFLFFLSHFNLSFLFLNYCLHLSLLHKAGI